MSVWRLLACVSEPFRPSGIGTDRVASEDWLKWDDWVVEQHARILDVWRTADRPFEPGHGVDLEVSVQKGRQLPEEARKEHERQKEMGWDVDGNIDA